MVNDRRIQVSQKFLLTVHWTMCRPNIVCLFSTTTHTPFDENTPIWPTHFQSIHFCAAFGQQKFVELGSHLGDMLIWNFFELRTIGLLDSSVFYHIYDRYFWLPISRDQTRSKLHSKWLLIRPISQGIFQSIFNRRLPKIRWSVFTPPITPNMVRPSMYHRVT